MTDRGATRTYAGAHGISYSTEPSGEARTRVHRGSSLDVPGDDGGTHVERREAPWHPLAGPIDGDRNQRAASFDAYESRDAVQSAMPEPRRNEPRLLVPRHVSQENRLSDDALRAPERRPNESANGLEQSASSRTINVTIGRIEVRGAAPAVTTQQIYQASTAPPSPTMSLDDYLREYNRSEFNRSDR